MDIERIKQNLRLRSGRTKVTRRFKKDKSQPPEDPPRPVTSPQQTQPPQQTQQNPNRSVTALPQSQPTVKEQRIEVRRPPDPEPEAQKPIQNSEQHNPPPEPKRPALVQSVSAGGGPDAMIRRKSTKYGNSGIEIWGEEEEGEEQQKAPPVPPVPQVPTIPPLPPMPPRTLSSRVMSRVSLGSEVMDFDLRPPAPKPKTASVEQLSELLFSAGHLNTILHHPQQLGRFTAFLSRFRPDDYPILTRYMETQKAVKAVEYANAVAETFMHARRGESNGASTAAYLDRDFQDICNATFRILVGTALPSYITYSLTRVVSECLTNEITGRTTPMMRDLIGGLSEVFCLADPNQRDCPIIYASDEFFRMTGYGPYDVIGSNCRFLQGRRTRKESVRRLRSAIEKGEETSETLVNYRRDGRSFINLLMLAPLHDDKGNLKYYIGAQVDVGGLVSGGRALEGFQRYLLKLEAEKQGTDFNRGHIRGDSNTARKKRTLDRLRDLSEMFDLEETAVVQAASKAASRADDDTRSITSADRPKSSRRMYVDSESSMSDDEEQQKKDPRAWTLGPTGKHGMSGKLPGIYETYMLVRPTRSHRIIFVSSKLRKLSNTVQSPFLSHVAAPSGTLAGLKESFDSGVPVSAKIHFMSERGGHRDGTALDSGIKHEDGKYGRACWISCTPLLGSDERVGVWMVVFVERSRAGTLRKTETPSESAKQTERSPEAAQRVASIGRREKPKQLEIKRKGTKEQLQDESEASRKDSVDQDIPIKPRRLDELTEERPNHVPVSNMPQIVATPVEEYRHSRIEPKPEPEADSELTKSDNRDAEGNAGHKEDDYVQTRSNLPHSDQHDRVVIRPDSEGDPESPTKVDGNHTPLRGYRHEPSTQSPAWAPDSEIPPSIPSDAQLQDDSDEPEPETPTANRNPRSLDGSEREATDDPFVEPDNRQASTSRSRDYLGDHGQDDYDTALGDSHRSPPTSPDSETADSAARPHLDSKYRSSGTMLDFLRVGSQRGRARATGNEAEEPTSGVTGRGVPKDWRRDQGEGTVKEGSGESDNKSRTTDGENCARSPYSVD